MRENLDSNRSDENFVQAAHAFLLRSVVYLFHNESEFSFTYTLVYDDACLRCLISMHECLSSSEFKTSEV